MWSQYMGHQGGLHLWKLLQINKCTPCTTYILLQFIQYTQYTQYTQHTQCTQYTQYTQYTQHIQYTQYTQCTQYTQYIQYIRTVHTVHTVHTVYTVHTVHTVHIRRYMQYKQYYPHSLLLTSSCTINCYKLNLKWTLRGYIGRDHQLNKAIFSVFFNCVQLRIECHSQDWLDTQNKPTLAFTVQSPSHTHTNIPSLAITVQSPSHTYEHTIISYHSPVTITHT